MFSVIKTLMANGIIQVYSMFAETKNGNIKIVDLQWNSLGNTHLKKP